MKRIIFLLIYFIFISNSANCENIVLPESLSPSVIKTNNIKPSNNVSENLKNNYDFDNIWDKKLNIINGNIEKNSPVIDSENPKFYISKIYYSGNTVIKNKKINTITSKYEKKESTIEDLQNLCDEITALYRKKGFITSKAILPPQRVIDKTVRINIKEGKYGEIIVKGNRWEKTSYLKRVLSSYNIKTNSVLNAYDLKNGIAYLNDSSYMQGDMSIENSKENNKKNVILTIKDRYPIDLKADWNNAGQELAGRERGIFTVAQNNITGYGDSLSLSGFVAKGTIGSFENYSIPIGSKGTKLNLGHAYSNTNYGGMYKAYGLNGKDCDFTVGISRHLYHNDKWTIDGGVNLDFAHIKQSMNYIGELNNVHMAVLRTGLYGRREDNNGIWLVNAVVNKGLPFLSYQNGNNYSNFVSTNIGINRLQILPKSCYLLFNLNGQYSPDDLFSSEKLMLGGYNNRGYESATLLGDMGIYGSVELRTPVPFLKKILKERFSEFEKQTKLGFFYDFGGTYDSNGFRNYLTNKSVNLMQSIGVGIHVPVGKLLTANLDLGIPIGDKALIEHHGVRVTFSITSNIHNLWSQKYNKSLNSRV